MAARVRSLILLGAALLSGVLLVFWLREAREIRQTPIQSWTEDQTADCAIVLTGGGNRIREGMDLLARQSVSKLIISGVHPQAELHEILPNWAFYNLNEKNIVLDKRSKTTFGNAQQSLLLAENLRCHDVILITSRVHMHRAYRTFMAEFPREISIYPRSVVAGISESSWTDILVESFKSLFYSIWAYG